jgi:hypothetical protein
VLGLTLRKRRAGCGGQGVAVGLLRNARTYAKLAFGRGPARVTGLKGDRTQFRIFSNIDTHLTRRRHERCHPAGMPKQFGRVLPYGLEVERRSLGRRMRDLLLTTQQLQAETRELLKGLRAQRALFRRQIAQMRKSRPKG